MMKRQISPLRLNGCRRGRILAAASLLVLACLVPPTGVFAQSAEQGTDAGVWEEWKSVSYQLDPKASFQFSIGYPDIPVRSWKLVIDGADIQCDLTVLRVQGEELLYYKIKESHHEVLVPWGFGEEVIAVLTNRDEEGAFVVTLLGPPRDQVRASYSYEVNRALEAYASGRRLAAEEHLREALKLDPDDAVAMVMLASFRRDAHFYDEASELIDQALQSDLPPEMKQLAHNLRVELQELRAPLPAPVRDGVKQAEKALGDGAYQEALDICDRLLGSDLELRSVSRSRLHLLRGQALAGLDRYFEGIDAYTTALSLNQSRATEAIVYFYMGELYAKMGNDTQAEGAYTIALQYGLPSGLEVQAREALREINQRLQGQR